MNQIMWIATGIFILAYAFIITEKIHRTVVALIGAIIMILAGFITQEDAFLNIDFNTIGLLTGMMIIVAISRETGMFEYAAIKAVHLAKGDPVHILIFLALFTALASAFLDNVTTVLLVVPVTMMITRTLGVDPIPFLFSQIIASNIGGTATLIGDPPNIMIGSKVGLTFIDFIYNLAPIVIIIMIVTTAIFGIFYKKRLQVPESTKKKAMSMIPINFIKDYKLLKQSLFVISLVIIGFFFHGLMHMESATIALAGAAFLLLISRKSPDEILLGVEWPTLFFFMGLFVMVGTLDELGVIKEMAQLMLNMTGNNLILTTMLVLWLSAIASAIIDNIPFVATMIPLIMEFGQLSGMDITPLWWALSLGACLGGNGTLIGASANVVVAGIAEREGSKFTFIQFTKVGFPLMIISIILSTAYIYIVYLS